MALIRLAQAFDLRQRLESTFMPLVHIEAVSLLATAVHGQGTAMASCQCDLLPGFTTVAVSCSVRAAASGPGRGCENFFYVFSRRPAVAVALLPDDWEQDRNESFDGDFLAWTRCDALTAGGALYGWVAGLVRRSVLVVSASWLVPARSWASSSR
jgi:hypothetical protein